VSKGNKYVTFLYTPVYKPTIKNAQKARTCKKMNKNSVIDFDLIIALAKTVLSICVAIALPAVILYANAGF